MRSLTPIAVLFVLCTPSHAGIRKQPSWSAEGEFQDGGFGSSGVAFGDFNGDGFRDLAFSAPGGFAATIPGKVYVYLGSAEGLSPTPAWTAEGNQPDEGFGFGQVGFGDFNGDAYTDLAVAAPFRDGQRGAVFLWYGGPPGPGNPSGLGPNGTPANADWVRTTTQAQEQLGIWVGKAGDVNGDGRDDLMIGSYAYDNGQLDEGRVQLFHGSPTGPGSAPDWTAEADQTFAAFGHRFHDAHDINDDGYGDVVISAECYEEPADANACGGRAFVWLGSPSGLGAPGTPANADWWAAGDPTESQYSYWVSGLDFNGDHYGDVMVGAPTGTVAGVPFAGRVLVWFGGPSGAGNPSGLGPNGTHANADWRAEGTAQFQLFGANCETAGDVNADGYEDVVHSNFRWDPPGTSNGGEVVVWLGGPAGTPTGTAGNAIFHLLGTVAQQEVGGNAHTVRDLNGDGFADLYVMSGGPSTLPNAGRVDLYFGTCGATDGDGDGLAPAGSPGCAAEDATDCDDANGAVWEAPVETTGLRAGATKDTVVWDAVPPGGSVATPRYDTLRAASPGGFAAATCVETDGADTASVDATLPAPGAAFYYLVRAVNACPGASGQGSLGNDSSGSERVGASCP